VIRTTKPGKRDVSFRPEEEISGHTEISAGWRAQSALVAPDEIAQKQSHFEVEIELILAVALRFVKIGAAYAFHKGTSKELSKNNLFF